MKPTPDADLILDEASVQRCIERMAQELAAHVADPADCALVGIRTRGATLAARLREIIKTRHGWDLPLGILDITLYRDDLSQMSAQPLVRASEIDFDIEGKLIFLIDDVLYTGRTIRSALNALIDFGRPRRILLGVLIDRGHRELPIQADVRGMDLETRLDQQVRVCLVEDDDRDAVLLTPAPES